MPAATLPRRRQRTLGEIEAIGHRARTTVALVQGGQVEDLLAEVHQTHMRVQLVRDVAGFRIGAQHQTRNARTVAERVTVEFRMRVCRTLRMGAVPSFDDGRIDMIEPAAPIVPGDKDSRLVPEPTGD